MTGLAGNEQQSSDDGEQNGTVTSNPGGVIYEFDVDYAVETCDSCGFEDTYTFEYVYDEETEVDGFVLEDGMGFDDIVYGTYESKEGEDHEPISVTFESDICVDQLVATVKAGRVTGDVELVETEDGFVVSILDDERFYHPKNGKPYAISYIAFECAELELE